MADGFIIVAVMKLAAVLLSGFLGCAICGAADPGLAQVRSVYLFPMTNGLDQYLANRLTNLGVFRVVTDPKKADAVLTDRLGAAFESRLAELYPEPPPPKPAGDAKKKEEKEEKQETASPAEPPRASSFARGKGTLFLVNARARSVLWSIYEKPRNSTPTELDRTAARIAERLKRELTPK